MELNAGQIIFILLFIGLWVLWGKAVGAKEVKSVMFMTGAVVLFFTVLSLGMGLIYLIFRGIGSLFS